MNETPRTPVRSRTVGTALCAMTLAGVLSACSAPAASPAASQTATVGPPGGTAAPSEAITPSPAPPATAPVQEPSPTPASPSGSDASGTVVPTLTFAAMSADESKVELSGVVLDRVEQGGTCTFTLRSGSVVVVREQDGLADASSTQCGTVSFPRSELSPGTWDATLAYAGPSGSGTSASLAVVVR